MEKLTADNKRLASEVENSTSSNKALTVAMQKMEADNMRLIKDSPDVQKLQKALQSVTPPRPKNLLDMLLPRSCTCNTCLSYSVVCGGETSPLLS